MKHLKHAISYISVILFLFVGLQNARAQQTPAFAEYDFNPYLINGAYAGLAPSTEVSLNNSGFFNNIEGSPSSFALSIHSPFSRGKVGLGAGFIRDEIGVTTSTSAFATYSYKIFFDTKDNRPYWQIYTPNSLSFSISPGVQQFQDNLLELGIMDDPNFAANIDATIPTVGVGILLNLQSFYVGLSAPNVLGDALASNDQKLDLSSPFYGYLGYRFFSDMFEEIMIKPSMLLRSEKGAPLQIDTNVSFSYKNRFELGTGYRSNSSINLLAGVYLLKNIRAVYNYNLSFNDSPLGNTHGIIVSYLFGDGYARD